MKYFRWSLIDIWLIIKAEIIHAQNIWEAFFMPIFLPNFLAFYWCSPLHLKKQTKLIADSSRQKNARPIQNKLIVNMLIMKTIAQKTTKIIWDIQKIVTLPLFGILFGLLDSNIHYYSPPSDSWLHHRSPTSFLAVRFLVTQKSMLRSKTVVMKVPK